MLKGANEKCQNCDFSVGAHYHFTILERLCDVTVVLHLQSIENTVGLLYNRYKNKRMKKNDTMLSLLSVSQLFFPLYIVSR